MNFDNDLVVGKLRRWEKFLAAYRLPEWDAIPDFGLYMEQVVQLLKQYLDYLPPELRQTEPITAAAINNYVRTKLLPGDLAEEDVKKAYAAFALRHQRCAKYFIEQVRLTAAAMFDREVTTELNVRDTPEMIVSAAILSGFTNLFAEKLMLLEGKTLADGGSIEVRK